MSDAIRNLREFLLENDKDVLTAAEEFMSDNPDWDLMDAVDEFDSSLYNEWSNTYE